ncbi:MAG: type I DNA topoisomerase [Rhodobacteraceae bacterium]|nr:type I DNA topoisomerase [Paracoccaceae bacterium]MCY4196698.1 type I DNA topoisomerase [Paracoccaceae bacterium]
MPVVVVESPAKARTIEKYLGANYKVLASFGHVRDLPPRDGSVDPDHDFAMTWEVPRGSNKYIQEIAAAVKKDQDLILATDPDREGEAISWHIREVLRKRRGVKLDGEPKRVVFNSVTQTAVREAINAPRVIDMELVDAYLARRALDYLVGYRLSPILWRKLPGARSAGRVQSVCVRIIAEREREIENFKSREYWSVAVEFAAPNGETFSALLTELDGRNIDKFSLSSEADAAQAAAAIVAREFAVASVQTKPQKSFPPPPFMTATLQQEASRKLRMQPRETMQTAQKLYEDGLITYMRTDSVHMVAEAVSAARDVISSRFGNSYLPARARQFKSKTKNAQEAHESIRPTALHRDPQSVGSIDRKQNQLYALIWNRTIASQMKPAQFLQTRVEIRSHDERVGLRATGRILKFNGYQAVYEEGLDDPETDKDSEFDPERDTKSKLPSLHEGDNLQRKDIDSHQHFTKPPPRFTEASLVKKMVELGIGRPSTYSSIVATIQDRGYVSRRAGRLAPEPVGRLLVFFLQIYFQRYVEFKFTADLEEELDDIAGGRKQRMQVLDNFWHDFSAAINDASDLRIGEVLDRLADVVVPMLLPTEDGQDDSRTCPRCNGRLNLKLSKSSAYIACSNSSECNFRLGFDGQQARTIGSDPATGKVVNVEVGRYGPYLQLGSATDEESKPKRANIPKDMDADDITLETALDLLSLPRNIGAHPEDGAPIEAGIGPYGAYLRHAGVYANIKDSSEILTIGMNRAVELIAAARSRKGGSRGKSTAIGEHPQGGTITSGEGRYGPYVKWKRVFASIPKDISPDDVTIDDAVRWLTEKINKKKR